MRSRLARVCAFAAGTVCTRLDRRAARNYWVCVVDAANEAPWWSLRAHLGLATADKPQTGSALPLTRRHEFRRVDQGATVARRRGSHRSIKPLHEPRWSLNLFACLFGSRNMINSMREASVRAERHETSSSRARNFSNGLLSMCLFSYVV